MTRNTSRVAIALVLAVSMLMWAPAAAAYGTAADAGTPADVEIGDDEQAISDVTVDVDEAGQDGVDVYYDVTALDEAGVDVDSLGVTVGEVTNAELVDQNVAQTDGYTTVRLTFDVAEDADSFTVSEFTLTGLDTTGADETADLTYNVAVDSDERTGDNAPTSADAQTAAFDIVDDEDGEETTESDETTEEEGSDDEGTDESGAATEDPDGDSDTDDSDAEDGDADTDDSAPGFGVAVALVALLAAAFVAVRE